MPVILLADDNPADQALVRRVFGDLCTVRVAADGIALLQYFADRPANDVADFDGRADLVLLDINMPRMGGKEVLPRIRATPKGATVPIVVLSSSDQPGDVRECYRAGCNSYVTKPFEPAEYNKTLKLIALYWLGISVAA